jgi:pimeloyl-ACP methyl ester carboxylesterase
MQTVESGDGTEIAYDRAGDGPPVICLHGTGVRRTIWRPLGAQTEATETLAPDRRGRGDSGDGDDYSIDREIEDVQALAATCEQRPVLFGSSFGGLIALEAAKAVDPAGLVLYEPPMPRATVGNDDDDPRESLAARTGERIEAGDPEGAAELFFTEATGAESVEHWPIWPECVEFAHTIPRECRIVEEFDPSDVAVDAPALLLTGGESPPYLRAGIDILADRISDTTVAPLEGVGHAGIAAAPARVAEYLEPFVIERGV